MKTLSEVMAELEAKGSEKYRNTICKHGIVGNVYGTSVADMKVIAKSIKGRQDLACELFETGNYEAMYLAGLVADGKAMTKQQLESWVKKTTFGTISEYIVPWLATENAAARELANKWIASKKEPIAAAGWCTWAGIVATRPDEELDLKEIETLLDRVAETINQSANRVRYTMNGFVISVGGYVKPLLQKAKAVAKKLGTVKVDMGDTACKVPFATEYIAKIESMGRVGKKRNTIRC